MLHGDESDRVYRKIVWRLIPFLILCYFCAFIDRSNVAIAKIDFMPDLGFTEAAYGLGGGLFYLGYSLFEVPSNYVLARVGARRTIARILILWSLFSATMGFMQDAEHYYILRFLVGAAEAGFFPGVLFYLSQWVPVSRRARVTALFVSAMTLSGVIGNPLSGWIMHAMDGFAGLEGWRWVFFAEGVPGIFLGVIALFYLTDKPEQAKWLSARQKQIVQDDLAHDNAQKAATAHGSFWSALRDPRFYLLAFMSMALFAAIGGLTLWLPSIVKKTGITNIMHVGLISAAPYLCALVSQQLVARSSDLRKERVFHAALPAIVGAVGWMALPFAQETPMIALFLITVAAAGTFGATGVFWTMPAQALSGSAAAGGIAVITTFGSIAGFVSPILVGWMTERTGTLTFAQFYYGGFLGLAALLLIAALPGAQRKMATAQPAPAKP